MTIIKRIRLLLLRAALFVLFSFLFKAASAANVPQKTIPFHGMFIGFNKAISISHLNVSHKNQISLRYGNVSKKLDMGLKGEEYGINIGYTHRYDNIGIGLEGVYNLGNGSGHNRTKFASSVTSFEKLSLKRNVQIRANLSCIICEKIAPKLIIGWNKNRWRREIRSISPNVQMSHSHNDENYIYGIGIDFLLVEHLVGGVEYTKTNGKEKKISLNKISETSFKPTTHRIAFVMKYIY